MLDVRFLAQEIWNGCSNTGWWYIPRRESTFKKPDDSSLVDVTVPDFLGFGMVWVLFLLFWITVLKLFIVSCVVNFFRLKFSFFLCNLPPSAWNLADQVSLLARREHQGGACRPIILPLPLLESAALLFWSHTCGHLQLDSQDDLVGVDPFPCFITECRE